MTDEEVLRTLQSMKPCVVNAKAQNEAIDRACEWGKKIREIRQIVDGTNDFWVEEMQSAYKAIKAVVDTIAE